MDDQGVSTINYTKIYVQRYVQDCASVATYMCCFRDIEHMLAQHARQMTHPTPPHPISNVASCRCANAKERYQPHPTPPHPKHWRAVPLGGLFKKVHVFSTTEPPTRVVWIKSDFRRRSVRACSFPATCRWVAAKRTASRMALGVSGSRPIFGEDLMNPLPVKIGIVGG